MEQQGKSTGGTASGCWADPPALNVTRTTRTAGGLGGVGRSPTPAAAPPGLIGSAHSAGRADFSGLCLRYGR